MKKLLLISSFPAAMAMLPDMLGAAMVRVGAVVVVIKMIVDIYELAGGAREIRHAKKHSQRKD